MFYRLFACQLGTGIDCTIGELAEIICDVVGFEGKVVCDTTEPDGTPQKLLDVSRLQAMGWRSSITLKEGIEETYRWFVNKSPRI